MSFFSSKPKPIPVPVEEPPRKPPMAMPNVFVVPPEEDQTPPWCFFHAENPELSQIAEQSETPDHSNIFELPSDADSRPPFSRDATDFMPGRNIETVSIVEALMRNRDDGDDSGSETSFEGEMDMGEDEEGDAHSIQENDRHESSRDQEREPADDSDVIEVVKVSRRKSLAEDRRESQSVRAFSEYKRSGTLKSRASKVFRSLRGTLGSKPRAQDIFPPPPPLPTRKISQKARKPEPSEPETVSRPRTPTISRRGSGMLSQLFTAPALKSRPSVSSFNEQTPAPEEADLVPSPPTSPQSSHFGSIPLSRRTSLYTLGQEDETRLRAGSPTPTTISSKSGNRRRSFSIMRMFSFSSSASSNTPSTAPAAPMPTTATDPYDESDRATPTQHSNSSTPSAASSISTVSSPQPQTPTSSEEATPVRLVTKDDEPTEPPMFGNFDSVFETNVGLNLGLGLSLDDSNELSISSRQTTPRKNVTSNSWGSTTPTQTLKRSSNDKSPSRTDDPGDTSLEMRLDSFHFDDLSFDANRF